MKNEIIITVRDQKGRHHILHCPTNIGFTLKDICSAYELGGRCKSNSVSEPCHCYVLDNAHALAPKDQKEVAMLLEFPNISENSRIACQIPIAEEMNGFYIQMV